MEMEESAFINEKRDEEIAKENKKTKEKKKNKNREYQCAWRQRRKNLKKKDSKEEKEEEKRKRHRENQRAYYQRTKGLKKNDKNDEELSQQKLDDLQTIRKKLDSNEDQENVVQCTKFRRKSSQNLENIQLDQNQFLTQQLRIYEESHECITPKVILHRNTDIPGDGNCLFHSLIRVLQLQILTCDLRKQLRDSPYLNSCHNPQAAYNILSSNNEYGDLDCLYLFSKIYNQNICVHYHYFNVISKNEYTRFCHFKENDAHNWIHLDLRDLHFTPYFSDDEKKKEDERKKKQRNKEYSKRYRDKKKRTSNLQTDPSDRDVSDVQPVIHTSQMTRKKLDINEDQENLVQCTKFRKKSSQNLENIQLDQNQFLTRQVRIYEESHECITPKVILHRNTDAPDDGKVTHKLEAGDPDDSMYEDSNNSKPSECKSGEKCVGHRCSDCGADIISFRYVCVQCAEWDMCGACEARGAHAAHYVLRVPSPKPREEIQAVLTIIRQELINSNLLILHDPPQMSVKVEVKEETPEALFEEFEITPDPLQLGDDDLQLHDDKHPQTKISEDSDANPPLRKRPRPKPSRTLVQLPVASPREVSTTSTQGILTTMSTDNNLIRTLAYKNPIEIADIDQPVAKTLDQDCPGQTLCNYNIGHPTVSHAGDNRTKTIAHGITTTTLTDGNQTKLLAQKHQVITRGNENPTKITSANLSQVIPIRVFASNKPMSTLDPTRTAPNIPTVPNRTADRHMYVEIKEEESPWQYLE